jgi:hypothetical protein
VYFYQIFKVLSQIKREKPRKEEHFYQNLQGFKRRKMKNPKKTKKNKKKETLGWFFF